MPKLVNCLKLQPARNQNPKLRGRDGGSPQTLLQNAKRKRQQKQQAGFLQRACLNQSGVE